MIKKIINNKTNIFYTILKNLYIYNEIINWLINKIKFFFKIIIKIVKFLNKIKINLIITLTNKKIINKLIIKALK